MGPPQTSPLLSLLGTASAAAGETGRGAVPFHPFQYSTACPDARGEYLGSLRVSPCKGCSCSPWLGESQSAALLLGTKEGFLHPSGAGNGRRAGRLALHLLWTTRRPQPSPPSLICYFKNAFIISPIQAASKGNPALVLVCEAVQDVPRPPRRTTSPAETCSSRAALMLFYDSTIL